MPPSFFFDASVMTNLPPAALEAYEQNGLLVLKNFIPKTDCQALMDRMEKIIEETDPADITSVFSTTDRDQINDDYLINSADKIAFFLEEGAVDPSGILTVPLQLAINKVGHGLHDRDEVFNAFSRQKKFAMVAAALGVQDPVLMQSMYIFKQAGIGGEVTCHQDAPFLWTTPQSVIGLWVALEDATLENGCLWAIPGAHLEDQPRSRYRVQEGRTQFDTLDERPWAEDQKIPLEVKAGTLVVLHGQVPHLSAANTSSKSRHAYALHLVDGLADYSSSNWLQRPASDPATGFYP